MADMGASPEAWAAAAQPSVSAAKAAREPRGEKERVYVELERVQKKCASLKRELNLLRAANGPRQNAALRAEAGRYKQALSSILHRLDTGDGVPAITDADLRHIVEAALALRGLKPSMRDRIVKAYGPKSAAPPGPEPKAEAIDRDVEAGRDVSGEGER